MIEKVKKLDKLKQQQEKLKVKIQRLEAAEKTRERKRETRRKIVVGAYYLSKARELDRWDDLVVAMDKYLKRDIDRQLFNLKSIEVNQLTTKEKKVPQTEKNQLGKKDE